MIKTHRRSRLRNIAGWAAMTAVAGVTLGLSAPTAAQDEVKEDVVREVRITRVGKDGKPGSHGDKDARHMVEMEAKCADGERAETKIDTGGEEKRSKLFVVLCEEKGTTPAAMREKMIAALEKAQGHVSTGDRLPVERRAEVAARIAEEIARLRSQQD